MERDVRVRRAELLAAYDERMRAHPPPAAGFVYESADGVVRALGEQNVILYSKLDAANATAIVGREIAHFERLERSVTWKVYGHDRPADLAARLEASGFTREESETFLAAELEKLADPQADFDIRTVANRSDLRDMAATYEAAFARPAQEFFARFEARIDDPALKLFVAYVRGRPVSAGRLEVPPEREFASLWGGGTIPEFRGRGIFTALVYARAAQARRLGYRYLTVDARETSRPILERLGFRTLTSVTDFVFETSRTPPAI